MRIKKKKTNKTGRFAGRCTEEQENRLQTLANLYTEGNVSEWMLYASLNYVPSKEELETGE